jgi:hypothetical protein
MFKSIDATLEQRRKSIGRQADVVDVAQSALLAYLQENYPGVSAHMSMRYQDTDRILIIATQNKTLAGELLLHIPELTAHLTAHGIRVERIIVR